MSTRRGWAAPARSGSPAPAHARGLLQGRVDPALDGARLRSTVLARPAAARRGSRALKARAVTPRSSRAAGEPSRGPRASTTWTGGVRLEPNARPSSAASPRDSARATSSNRERARRPSSAPTGWWSTSPPHDLRPHRPHRRGRAAVLDEAARLRDAVFGDLTGTTGSTASAASTRWPATAASWSGTRR